MNRLATRHLIWSVMSVALAGFLALAVWTRLGTQPRQGGWNQRPLEGLTSFGTVPDFSLTERSGMRLSLAELKGKIWIANFIYTSCKDTCPLQSAALAKLQGELPKSDVWRVVSVSVDPQHDTPAELSRYAERFGADPQRWLFLTGDKSEIYRLAQEGFHLSAAPASDGVGQNGPITLHSSRFVLVDGQARIRGYYDSQDAEALARLREDVKKLFRENKA